MKRILELILLLVLFFSVSGCGEPGGGGAGYQYLGTVDNICRNYDINGKCISIITVEKDSFTVAGEVNFNHNNAIWVWVNISKNTVRLRRQSVTIEHGIISWKSLEWREQK